MASILRVKDQNGNEIDIPAIKGASAYEIAVKNGFKGTEEEWLESLKGGSASSLISEDVIINDETEAFYTNYQLNNIILETTKLPNNARVKKVEIPDMVNGTGEYLMLEDMVAKDSSGLIVPYFIMYPKNMSGAMFPTSKIATIVAFPENTNSFFETIGSYAYSEQTIKIYYEIEE